MQTNVQSSSNVPRTISLLAIVTVTLGIGLAASDAGRRPLPADTNTGRALRASSPAQLAEARDDSSAVRSDAATPHFVRSNEPPIEADLLNAHGG